MPLQKPTTPSTTRDFKHRVHTCLNKLSDRDTHSAAATELETIARTLPHDLISPFLTSISATNSSDKSPVRKQCVRLLSTLSESHGHVLSTTHCSKLISAVLRRIRDPDTAVRSACVSATNSIAVHVTKCTFMIITKPLVEALVTEQEVGAQTGAALCLAAAVDGAPDPDLGYLRRVAVRVEKLVRCDGFKAKAALLAVLGSVIGVGGASGEVMVKSLVDVLVGVVVKSEDWGARKAAAEALEKLAVVERGLLLEYKASCLKTFEAKKFDKVKIVREAMNQMIEAWKAIPDVPEEVLTITPPESQSSSKAAKVATDNAPRTPRVTNRKTAPTVASTATATRRISPETSNRKTGQAMFRKLDRKKVAATATLQPASPLSVDDTHLTEKLARPERKRALFNDIVDEEVHEVEYHDTRLGTSVVESNITEDIHKSQKDSEELCLIRNHLVQIETQQSNLLDLLHKFTTSSETGMRSLETRVHGLESTLDEISFDLARSTGRLSHSKTTQTLCCKLPGAGLLTSKLWKKTETRDSNTRVSSSQSCTNHMTGKNMNLESCNPENRGYRCQGGGSGLIKNPLAVVYRNNHEISEI